MAGGTGSYVSAQTVSSAEANAASNPGEGSLADVTDFGEDRKGDFWIVTIGGNAFRIVPSGEPGASGGQARHLGHRGRRS